MTFQQKLDAIVEKNNSLLCVGLDPDFEKLPGRFKKKKHPQFAFNKFIVDQTYDLVCCYKPNSAFYEARGAEGISELKVTCDHIHEKYPEIPVLLDFKRGDIGNTNRAYAKFAFEYLNADAITLQPYQGIEALQPFLDYKEKGIFILCKTSNPGSGEFQNIHIRHPEFISGSQTTKMLKWIRQTHHPEFTEGQVQHDRLYEYVAFQVVNKWNKNKNCFLVVGATYPKELKRIREIVRDMTILVPGIGHQAGDLEKTLKAGLNAKKAGLIVVVSRSIIFAKNPRGEAEKLRSEINSFRS